MKRQFLLGLAVLVGFYSSALAQDKLPGVAKSISADRIAADIKYLSSDELEGRGVGTDGLDKAADHIVAEFKKMGLETKVFGDSPFQVFKLPRRTLHGPLSSNYLKFTTSEGTNTLAIGRDYNTQAIGGTATFDGEVVFVGYGVTAPNLGYDSYANVNVKGKAVLVLQGLPHGVAAFAEAKNQDHRSASKKVANALNHGATAIIFVSNNAEIERQLRSVRGRLLRSLDSLAQAHTEFRAIGEATPEQLAKYLETVKRFTSRIDTYTKQIESASDNDKPLAFNGSGRNSNYRTISVFSAKRSAVEPLVKGDLGSLTEAEDRINDQKKPQSLLLSGVSAAGQTNVIYDEVEVKNVVGVLEGKGPNANETIIVGAHYDHVGLGSYGSLGPWTAEVHNGADDNASGTATMLEIARQIAAKGPQNRRIVFIAFTAEELGMIGSKYYCDHPRFELKNTVAMINLDMIGRVRNDKVLLYGTGTATEFDEIANRLNKKYKFDMEKHPSGSGPSDHSSFYGRKIPIFWFFSDFHNDYHRPADDFEGIMVPGMQRITGMTVDIVTEIDKNPKRPTYVEMKQ
ncbi:MAG: M20/M25/M40 family metallo-hydrolase [Pirellulaceae bacterium]|nr:M20/M25/M40 family metallo-hydrolase [Pirellulaceae bacterium]